MAEPQSQRLDAILAQMAGGTPPLIGTPQPNYSLTGNPSIDLIFGQYLQGVAGPGRFLPQQYPAQNLLDQMVSAKYSSASRLNSEFLRNKDNDMLATRLEGARSRFDATPLTETGRAELRNFAGYINNPITQQLASTLMGPQMMEDMFFGQRGSAQMLGNAVSQIGFYRPDAVTGQRRMSGESLQAFSEHLYDNLYGPSADLNDVSGFSAGRVGSVMTDLAQRGLLPASYSKLDATARRRELDSGLKTDIGALNIAPELKTALGDADKPLNEISEMAGGADAIRKVDATRVSRALKEYTGAISVVREIFGDNGMPNAPMNQLMAAMEALTQNSMSSMQPGQIESIMRRTQMASRDSGVSLEALLGLNARTGAIADKYGLPRELAAEGAITAMERVQGLRDTGGFAPGFGRLDPNKAALAFADENMRVAASKVGRYVGAAQHAANQGLVADGSDMQKMLSVLNSGGQTMALNGKTVNIYEELARDPDALIRPMFTAAGINSSHMDALLDSPESREALLGMPGLQLHLAAGKETKRLLGENLAQRGTFESAMTDAVPPAERTELAETLSATFGAAAIDNASTQLKPHERIAALRKRMHHVFRQRVLERDPTLDYATAGVEAEKLMTETFGGTDKVNNILSEALGNTEQYAVHELNTPLPQLQQAHSAAAATTSAKIRQENLARAAMFDLGGAALTGSGNNFVQRMSDAFVSGKGGIQEAFEKGLGVVSNTEVAKKMRETLGAENEKIYNETVAGITKNYEENVLDTEDDHEQLVETAKNNFAEAASYFQVFDAGKPTGKLPTELENKTQLIGTDELTTQLKNRLTTDDAFKKHIATVAGEDIDPTNDKAVRALAQRTDIDLQLAPGAISEAQFRDLARGRLLVKPGQFEVVEQQKALANYFKNLGDGTSEAVPTAIFDALGVGDEDFAQDDEVRKQLEELAAGRNSEDAENNLRDSLSKFGIDADTTASVIALGKVSGVYAAQGGAKSFMGDDGNKRAAATARLTKLQKIDTDRQKTNEERRAKGLPELPPLFEDGSDAAKMLEEDPNKITQKTIDQLSSAETTQKTIRAGFTPGAPVNYGNVEQKDLDVAAATISADLNKSAAAFDKAGGGGTPFSGLADELSSAITTAFSGDKISANFNEVKVHTLQLPAEAAKLVGAAPAADGKPLTITGEVSISGDLTKAIITLVQKQMGAESANTPGDGGKIIST